jgi:hypothetical protein
VGQEATSPSFVGSRASPTFAAIFRRQVQESGVPPRLASPKRPSALQWQSQAAILLARVPPAGREDGKETPVMRRIDASERPMPEINPAKVCFVIEKSREYLSEDLGVDPDASNPTDDDERVVLTDAAGHSVRRELIEFIRDLDVDESAALVALAWIGRGDFEPQEWRKAVALAGERAAGPTWKYLLGMALLPDYLEDALSAFDRSCEDFESGSRDEG